MNFAKKLLASSVAASVLAVSAIPAANAEIELGEGLSVGGFVDMSFNYIDTDGADSAEKVFGVDQVETDFFYKGSNGVSAQVDIEYGEGEGEDGGRTFVEQAFVTKQINDQFSVKAGRFLSYSGWEAEEPTGLFQYSGTGYAPAFYGYYQQGASAYYDGGMVDFSVSIVNSLVDPVDDDTSALGTELGIALQPMEGLTAKLFYLTESDTDKVNFWTSYEVAGWTFALEYNTADYADGFKFDPADAYTVADADGYLLMANYATGDFGVTVRYHDWSADDAAGTTVLENSAITLAPSYAIGDNLLVIAEYRMDDNGAMADTDTFTIEVLFSF